MHLTGTDAAACVAATATAGACPVVDLAVREEGPAPKAGGGLAGNVRRVRGGGELLLVARDVLLVAVGTVGTVDTVVIVAAAAAAGEDDSLGLSERAAADEEDGSAAADSEQHLLLSPSAAAVLPLLLILLLLELLSFLPAPAGTAAPARTPAMLLLAAPLLACLIMYFCHCLVRAASH